MEFRWNEWNVSHIANHGVSPRDAEFVVRHAKRPFPRRIEDEKHYVAGQTAIGRYIQVIYVLDEDGTAFVLHARDLNDSEKRKFRRRTR